MWCVSIRVRVPKVFRFIMKKNVAGVIINSIVCSGNATCWSCRQHYTFANTTHLPILHNLRDYTSCTGKNALGKKVCCMSILYLFLYEFIHSSFIDSLKFNLFSSLVLIPRINTSNHGKTLLHNTMQAGWWRQRFWNKIGVDWRENDQNPCLQRANRMSFMYIK